MVRTSGDDLLVDLAVESPPVSAPTITPFGPAYPPEELAARKVLALFDRAAARDFVDVHVLAARFSLEHLVDMAAQLDHGFDQGVLVEMLGTVDRFTDEDLAELGADPTALRAFVDRWRSELADRPG